MTRRITNKEADENIASGLLLSVSLHVALLAAVLLKTVLFPSEPIVFQEAIRVDIVGLPDKIKKRPVKQPVKKVKKEAPAKKAKVAAKPKPKKTKKISLKKTKSIQSKALQKLKALEALAKLKKTKVTKEATKPTPEPKYRGNVLSAGTALSGLNKLQHDKYLSTIKGHINKNWFLPEWLAKQDLKAEIKIKFDKAGKLIEDTLITSSGNPEYDDLVQQAVRKSDPFPAPPDKFRDILEVDGFLMGFP